jgi:putative heme-binding domain-containing protein
VRFIASDFLADDDLEKSLLDLLQPQQPLAIHLAVLDSLQDHPFDGLEDELISVCDKATPEVRKKIEIMLVSRPAWALKLLHAIQTHQIEAHRLDTQTRHILANHSDPDVAKLAALALHDAGSESKNELLDRFAVAEARPGNIDRGRVLFRQHCAPCHRLNGEGANVGPDLASLTNRDRHWLLTTILDPNREVDSRYQEFIVQLADGRLDRGIIAEETSQSIVLRKKDGERTEVLRREIDDLRSSKLSMMPEGLEQEIDPESMGDLIEYVIQFSR